MPSSKLIVAALVAAVLSFTSVAAAEDPQITPPPPTPTSDPADEIYRRQVAGAPGTPILSTLHFAFTDLPEQVYPFQVLRGPQFGFNRCNDTTLGPNSNCQTLIFNNASDFCLWGSPDPDGTIGDVEAKVVAYCTTDKWGTRVIPRGAITGLQFMRTSGYIQVVGSINNSALSLDPNDPGGELDPHGADLQGNPLGGVVYSNGTTDSTDGNLVQVFNWNNFVGNGQFCFKACFNSITSPDYCENRYDLVGCQYNMPNNAQPDEFTDCEGDLQDVVGTYTTDGTVLTWSMPPTLTTPPPYTPRIPASSNCVTFQSSELFGVASTSSSPTAGATPGNSGSGSSSSTSKTGSGASPSNTSASGALSLSASIGFGFVGLLACISTALL